MSLRVKVFPAQRLIITRYVEDVAEGGIEEAAAMGLLPDWFYEWMNAPSRDFFGQGAPQPSAPSNGEPSGARHEVKEPGKETDSKDSSEAHPTGAQYSSVNEEESSKNALKPFVYPRSATHTTC